MRKELQAKLAVARWRELEAAAAIRALRYELQVERRAANAATEALQVEVAELQAANATLKAGGAIALDVKAANEPT